MLRRLVLLLTSIPLVKSLEGPICILGDPGRRCIESTGAFSAFKVMALCQVKMYPMQLSRGSCEQKGFTCKKSMSGSRIWSGMKIFDKGNCSSSVSSDASIDVATQEAATVITPIEEKPLQFTPHLGGPVCIMGNPGVRCIESTGVLSAVKVTGLCQIKMYPMELGWGTCEHKGFTCPKMMPDEKMWYGMKEFDAPPKAGNCSSNLGAQDPVDALTARAARTAMTIAQENYYAHTAENITRPVDIMI